METDTISDSEFAREVEALRAQRRISVHRPVIDPDLPDIAPAHNNASASHDALNGQFGERVDLRDDGPRAQMGTGSVAHDEAQPSRGDLSASRSSRQQFTARRRGPGASQQGASPAARKPPADASDKPLSTDPAHLFWVPASMHPEISPADFRQFLSEHAARAVRDAKHSAGAAHSPTSPSSPTHAGEGTEMSLSDRVAALRHQTDSSTSAGPSSDLLSRSTSLTRRGSTLRRQYQPENDTAEDEGRPGMQKPPLTLEELQQLEQIAEETTSSHDAARVRNVLRRNLSLDIGPSGTAADVQDPSQQIDEADAPIIVPLPGQILRRAARTKVRKASLSSDGRPGASRRRAGQGSLDAGSTDGQRRMDFADVALAVLERTPSNVSEPPTEVSSSDETEMQSSTGDLERRSGAVSDEQTDEILDAYSRDSFLSDSETQRSSVTSLPESERELGASSLPRKSPPMTPTAASVAQSYFDIPRSDNHQYQQPYSQQPHHAHSSSQSSSSVPIQLTPEAFVNARIVPVPDSTSPEGTDTQAEPAYGSNEMGWPQSEPSGRSGRMTPVMVQRVPSTPPFEKSPSVQSPYVASIPVNAPSGAAIPPQFTQQLTPSERSQTAPLPGVATPLGKTKEKEKKGSFGLSWFGLGKDEEERANKKKEKDSESSGFLSNLFSKKKNNEDGGSPQAYGTGTVQKVPFGAGQITAGSLLDRQAQGLLTMGPNRYPIHIERAVYRLSHIKLANPRRPLYEQVLISNLMFWYLSIINKNQQAQQQQRLQQQQQQQQQQQSQQQQQQQQAQQQAGQTAAQQQQASPSVVDGADGPARQTSPAQTAQLQQGLLPSQHVQQPSVGSSPGALAPQYAGAGTGVPQGGVGGSHLVSSEVGAEPNGDITVPHVAGALQPNGVVGSSAMDTNGIPAIDPSATFQPQQLQPAQVQAQGAGSRPAKGKRGPLVKANRAPPGARAAEMPIPAAGYGMQHRQISDDMALQRDVQHFQQQQHQQKQAQQRHQQQPSGPQTQQDMHVNSSDGFGGMVRQGGFAVGQVLDPRDTGSQPAYNASTSNLQEYSGMQPHSSGSASSPAYGQSYPAAATAAAPVGDVVGRNATDGWVQDDGDMDVYGGVTLDYLKNDSSPPSSSTEPREGQAWSTAENSGNKDSRSRLASAFGETTHEWTREVSRAPIVPAVTTSAERGWTNSYSNTPSPNTMGASPMHLGGASPSEMLNPTASPLTTPTTANSPPSRRSRSPAGHERRSEPTQSSPSLQSLDGWTLSGGSSAKRDRSSDPVERVQGGPSEAGWTNSGYQPQSRSPEQQRSPPTSARRMQTAQIPYSKRPLSPPSNVPYGMQRSTSLEDNIMQHGQDGDRPPSSGATSRYTQHSPSSSTGTSESFRTAIAPGNGLTSPSKARSPSATAGSSAAKPTLHRTVSETSSNGQPWPNGSPSLSPTSAKAPANKLGSPGQVAGAGSGATGGRGDGVSAGSFSLSGTAASLAMLEAAKQSRERRR